MDVVKGALAERQKLTERFVRKSETVKSYGTLVALQWGKNLEGTVRFPNAITDGAVQLEKQTDGLWLKVIEWAIPKVGICTPSLDVGVFKVDTHNTGGCLGK